MALNIWTKPSGYSFGTIQEQTTVFIPLPVQGVVPVPGYGGQNRSTRSTDLNSAFAPFGRIAHPRYTDGVYSIPTGLPNPRTISNLVCYGPAAGNGSDASQQAAPGNQSAYAYAWGQFITHEISFASAGTVDASITVPSNDTTYSVPATSTLSSIDGTTLTVGGVITGVFTRGQFLTGTGLIPGTQIVDYGTGDGGAGTCHNACFKHRTHPRNTIAGSTTSTLRIESRLASSTMKNTATAVMASTCQGMKKASFVKPRLPQPKSAASPTPTP